jgi:plastocyanin
MIWHSGTRSSPLAPKDLWVIVLLLLVGAVPCRAASVTGNIQLVGSRDASVRKRHDLSGVVVWLAPVDALPQPVAATRVRMIQKNKRFEPHVLAITVGTTVDFPNFDPIFHSAFSNFSGQIFDLSLYPPGSTRSVYFRRSGVVRVFCNIHPTMSAIIAVLESPYFSVSDKHGKFVISNVPPGSYHLHVIHERATPETLNKLTHTVNVSGSTVDLPLISVSESGYLPVPHKNKYGLEYPPAVDDVTGYPAQLQ